MTDSLELFSGFSNINTTSTEVVPQLINSLGLPSNIEQVSNFSRRVSGDSYAELVNAENAVGRNIRITEQYYVDSIFPNFITSYSDTEAIVDTSPNILSEPQNYFVRQEGIASTLDPLTGETIGSSIDNSSVVSGTLKIKPVPGTLKADYFTLESGFDRLVFSGNGNVEFGSGKKDILDLSSIGLRTVNFNLAKPTGGGVLFNPGNGDRLFDAITLNDGRKILFEGIDSIKFADQTIDLSITPNDPLFKDQWNLHMMGVHNAWGFTTGSTDVLIGVQDTGLGINNDGVFHGDLRRTTIYKSNYADDFFRDIPDEFYGPQSDSHGTSVQSIIAANSNNGKGMSGINWDSPVFHIDVLDGNKGDRSVAQATQNMIDSANKQGQRLIINMSFGGGGIDSELEQLVANNSDNALFVIASGNEDASSISYPSSLAQKYSNVIAVGASWGTHDADKNETKPGTRISYPDWWGSNYGDGLTLMGPSEVIATSATKKSPDSAVEFDYSNLFNGTSAATPNVAGVASLVWGANSNLTASQIKQIMSQTAYDLGTTGYDTTYGHGFVNADAAVRRAIAMKFTSTSQNENQA